MLEIPETLLEETSDLLDALIPIVQRSIEALQNASSPLVQHLEAQEIKHQENLLEQIAEIKEKLQDCLNPPDEAAQPTQSQYLNLRPDLHSDEIGFVYLSTPDPVMTRLSRFCKTFSALQTVHRYSLTPR